MRIATWNVNSIRARAERVIDVLERHDLDALAMQEIKCKPDQFPREAFLERGYELAIHGLNQWNGVAIASRIGLDGVLTEFPGQPGFTKGEPETGTDKELGFISEAAPEARALSAVVGAGMGAHPEGVRLWSLYVPNGRAVGDPHYHYKLEFLRCLREYVEAAPSAKAQPLALVGDWNVIPTDQDVWDPSAIEGGLYMTDAERAAFFAMGEAGLTEVTHERAEGYTFWDYKQLRFPRNEGMRIDFVFGSEDFAARVRSVSIDRDERKGKGASDHVPVIVELED